MVGIVIIKALYLFLPVYFANMVPVLFKWLPFLNKPIHERWFGKNKTWRGLVVAVLFGIIIFSFQKLAYNNGFTQWAVIDYLDFSVGFVALLGFGVILGVLIESWLKRKAGIAPGKRWFPWDQLDFVFGGLLFMFFIYIPPAEIILTIIVFSPVLHIVVNRIAYYLRIRKVKW